MKPAISNQVPNAYAAPDGKFSTLGFVLLGLTFAALIYQIYESRVTIKSLQVSDKRMTELEHNLKSALGNKYQKL